MKMKSLFPESWAERVNIFIFCPAARVIAAGPGEVTSSSIQIMFDSLGPNTEAISHRLLLLDMTNVIQSTTLPVSSPRGTSLNYVFTNVNPETMYTIIIAADTSQDSFELVRVPVTTEGENKLHVYGLDSVRIVQRCTFHTWINWVVTE